MKPRHIKDFLVSNETFVLRHEASIDAWKTTPEIPIETLQNYYPKEDYLSHADKAKSLKSRVYLWVKKRNINTKLRWISKIRTNGSLLDFGAGNGAFALAAEKNGWNTRVFDSSESAKKSLVNKGLKQADEIQPNDNYDVITLWHVFEHLAEPQFQLNRFYEALVPGGILVLALPNHHSWDAKHYGTYWAAYDVPRHIWHYNKQSVFVLAQEAGFDVLKTYNMFWDAFYVALLSEQYKKSNYAWPLGILKGLYSNVVGWSKNNTSSLTFILQKPK